MVAVSVVGGVDGLDHEGGEVLEFDLEVGEGKRNEFGVDAWDVFGDWKEGWREAGLEVVVVVFKSQVRQLEDVEEFLWDHDLESLKVNVQVGHADVDSFVDETDDALQVKILKGDEVDVDISERHLINVDGNIERVLRNVNGEVEMVSGHFDVNGHVFLARSCLNPELKTD